MCTSEDNGIANEAIVISDLFKHPHETSQSCEKVMGWCTAECKMQLLCAKTIVKESHNFKLAA